MSRVNSALSLVFLSFPCSQAASVATLPSALLCERFFARCRWGVLDFVTCDCHSGLLCGSPRCATLRWRVLRARINTGDFRPVAFRCRILLMPWRDFESLASVIPPPGQCHYQLNESKQLCNTSAAGSCSRGRLQQAIARQRVHRLRLQNI